MLDWLGCVELNLRRFINGDFGLSIVGFIIVFLAGLAVVTIFGATSGQWEIVGIYIGVMLFVFLLFFGIWFVGALLSIMIACGVAVFLRALEEIGAGAPTAVGAAIAAGGLTCEAARALLAQAQAALAAAAAARDAQAARVADARARLRTATAALVAALAAVVASVFQPWAIPAAVAAVAAAAALIVRRMRQLAEALAVLAALEAALLRALADVAAAEALVAALCPPAPADGTGAATGPGGLLGGGAVPVTTAHP